MSIQKRMMEKTGSPARDRKQHVRQKEAYAAAIAKAEADNNFPERFDDYNTRSAFRSACWRMAAKRHGDGSGHPAGCCQVVVTLGDYLTERTEKELGYIEWLTEYFFEPFGFQKIETKKVGLKLWQDIWEGEFPMSWHELEAIRRVLMVPGKELTNEMKQGIFWRLDQLLGQTQPV